jgi:hypothetical protein
MMNETQWEMLPFPFLQIATVPHPLGQADIQDVLARVVKDVTGLAAVIAAALEHPDLDAQDLRHATRLLSEHAHCMLALWRQWDRHAETADEA